MANDVVFILRFDTKAGETQIRQFSQSAEAVLKKAFNIQQPVSKSLGEALGLKNAVAGLTTVNKELAAIQRSLAGLNTSQLQKLKNTFLGFDPNTGRFRDPITNKFIKQPGESGATRAIDSELRRREFENQLNPSRAKGGFFSQQFDVLRNKQTQDRINSTGDFLADTQSKLARQLQETELNRRRGFSKSPSFADISGSERAYGAAYKSEQARAFSESGRGKPSAFAKMFGANEQSFQEFFSHKRRGGARIGPEQALGISPTATRLLALSSVLQPLNAQLGMVAMQAGFAAFSLGAPVAALAILSAAVAGFRNLLMKSVDAAKAAGLETRKYNIATTELALEMQGFMKVLGVQTQQAFVPVVNHITELFKEIEDLPWNDIVKGAAATSESFLILIDRLKQLYDTAMYLPKQASKLPDFLQDKLGLKGSQRLDIGGLFGSMNVGGIFTGAFQKALIKEGKEIFQPPQDEREQFVYRPRFDFSQIEDLHMQIQKSIFKAEEKDPEVKALEAQSNIIRDEFGKTRQADKDNIREMLDGINNRVPIAVAQ